MAGRHWCARMGKEKLRRVLLSMFAILCVMCFIWSVQFVRFLIPLSYPFDPWLYVQGFNTSLMFCVTLVPSAFTVLIQCVVGQTGRWRILLPFLVWVGVFGILYGPSYAVQLKQRFLDQASSSATQSVVTAVASEVVWFAFLALVFCFGAASLSKLERRNP